MKKVLILLLVLVSAIACTGIIAAADTIDLSDIHIEKENWKHTDSGGVTDEKTNYYLKFNLKDKLANGKANITALDKDNNVITKKQVSVKANDNSIDLPDKVSKVNICVFDGSKLVYNKTITDMRETSNVTSDAPAQDSSSDSGEYWASAKSDKFHRPDCEWAQKISSKNKKVYHSRDDAIAAGNVPCEVCNP